MACAGMALGMAASSVGLCSRTLVPAAPRVTPSQCVRSRTLWGSSLAASGLRAARPQLPAWVLQAVRADAAVDTQDTNAVQIISSITALVDGQLAAAIRESSLAAQQPAAPPTSELRDKILASVHKLQTGLLERETEVRCYIDLTADPKHFHVFRALCYATTLGRCGSEITMFLRAH